MKTIQPKIKEAQLTLRHLDKITERLTSNCLKPTTKKNLESGKKKKTIYRNNHSNDSRFLIRNNVSQNVMEQHFPSLESKNTFKSRIPY